MAKVLIGTDYGSYTFNAALKQVTFVLPNNATAKLERVLLISNVITNEIIYNFSNPALGGTLAGNVLTLDFNTTSMNNTDSLQIWYYNETNLEVIDNQVASLTSAIIDLSNIIANGNATFDSGLRLRAILDTNSSIGTVSTVTTCNTVTSVSGVTTLNQFSSQSNASFPHSYHQTPIEVQMQKIIVT